MDRIGSINQWTRQRENPTTALQDTLRRWSGQDPYKVRASRRIMEFVTTPAASGLSLSGINLGYIPEPLFSAEFRPFIPQLTHLDLGFTCLFSVDPRIAQLSSLRSLNLAFNCISTLPPQISGLTNLRRLNLSENVLNDFPAAVFSLTQLQSLRMRDNEVERIPQGISMLQNLQYLDLSANLFTELPETFTQLRHLQSLTIEESVELSTQTLERIFSMDLVDFRYFYATTCPPSSPSSTFSIESILRDFAHPEDPIEWDHIYRPVLTRDGITLTRFSSSQSSEGDPDLASALQRWSVIGEWENIPELPLNLDQVNQVHYFITRLTDTRDYRSERGKEQLAKNLYRIIDALKDDSKRDDLIAKINDASTRCGDRITVGMDDILMDLDLGPLTEGADRETLNKLYDIGIKHHNLMVIDAFARAKAQSDGIAEEDLEVALSYRTQLHGRVPLPTYSTQMLFQNLAGVYEPDLQAAEDGIRNLSQTDRQNFFVQWAPWQSFLTRYFPVEFEQVACGEYQTPQQANDAQERFYRQTTEQALRDLNN